jgi:C4-dicarboxylate transporter DctM subunit
MMLLTNAWMLFVLLFIFVMIKIPIGISLGLASLVYYLIADLSLAALAQQFYTGLDSFALIAIPLFILAGSLMEKGGLSKRLARVADSSIGRVEGGMGMATILASSFFAAISGSGPATTAAVGGVMVPEMEKRNYNRVYAAAVAASGGVLGILIPPSLTFIVYGVIADLSIGKLFIAGVIPGVIFTLFLMIMAHLLARGKGYVSGEVFSPRRLVKRFGEAVWSLMAPVIILGGIYGGLFTPTESAAVAVVYGLIVGVFVYRELGLRDLLSSLEASAKLTGALAIIWVSASAFGNVVALNNIPQMVASYILGKTQNPLAILVIISLLLVLLGMIINAIAMIVILTPILLPVIQQVGIDPYFFGVFFTIMCEIGFLTPPVGTNLFVAMGLAKCSVEQISKAVIPFILVLYAGAILISIFPQICLFLPHYMIGK